MKSEVEREAGSRKLGALSITAQRLRNQKLVRSDVQTPAEIVSWLGAVQSQDYAGAKWALGLRSTSLADADVDRAFDDGTILRTHILRPTWHFVLPEDLRWMQRLAGPRLKAANRHYCLVNGLDDKTLARSRKVIEKALRGGFLTRTAVGAVLAKAGIPTDGGQRLAYMMMDAEIDHVICSGPRQGKQFTYALADERAPKTRAFNADEALAELTRRYFTSHGPATVPDFVWWSGLTVKHAKTGLEMLGRALASESVDGKIYWFAPDGKRTTPRSARPTVYLLPNYDEYLNALRDRSLAFDAGRPAPTTSAFVGMPHQLVIDGILRGAWKRETTPCLARITVHPFRALSRDEQQALTRAVARLGAFLKLPAELTIA
jgi:hypothetical protein